MPTLMPQMRGGKATPSGEARKRLTPAFSQPVSSPPRVGRALKVDGADLVRRVAVTADGDNLRSAGGLTPPRAWPPASAPRGAPAAAVWREQGRRIYFAPSARTAVDRNTAAQKRPRSENIQNAVVFNPPSQQGSLPVAILPLPSAQTRSSAPLRARLARLVTNARYRQVPCRLSTYPQASH